MKTVKDAYDFFGGELTQRISFNAIAFNDNGGFYSIQDSSVISSNDYLVCTRQEFEDYAKQQELNRLNNIIKEDAQKPVFTQEMADNGKLPPIGSEALLSISKFAAINDNDKKYDNHHCEIVTHVDTLAVAIVRDENSDICFTITANYSWFKPIDTRTDKEKLIDEVKSVLGNNFEYQTLVATAKALIEKFDIKLK